MNSNNIRIRHPNGHFQVTLTNYSRENTYLKIKNKKKIFLLGSIDSQEKERRLINCYPLHTSLHLETDLKTRLVYFRKVKCSFYFLNYFIPLEITNRLFSDMESLANSNVGHTLSCVICVNRRSKKKKLYNINATLMHKDITRFFNFLFFIYESHQQACMHAWIIT